MLAKMTRSQKLSLTHRGRTSDNNEKTMIRRFLEAKGNGMFDPEVMSRPAAMLSGIRQERIAPGAKAKVTLCEFHHNSYRIFG